MPGLRLASGEMRRRRAILISVFTTCRQVGFFGHATGSLVGRVAVYVGRVVRCYDRRLDNAERSSFSFTHDIFAPGGGLGLNGRRAVRGTGVHHQFHRRALLFGHYHGGAGKKKKISIDRSIFKLLGRHMSKFLSTGVHIGNLDAGHPRVLVGDVEGARSRRCSAVVHSRHVSELAAKRATSGRCAVDALFGDSLYTRDTVVSRAKWQR